MTRLLALFVILIVFLVAIFAAGPFFPWSPWKPGYQRLSTSNADVYYHKSVRLPAAYTEMEAILEEAQSFHRLPLKTRLTIVHSADWYEFRRFLPHRAMRAERGATLATGTVIYISPFASEENLDPAEFLRHEVSHALLHQHQSITAAVKSERLWPFEGLAVLFSRQTSYRSEAELREYSRKHSLLLLFDPDLRGRDFDPAIAHTAWKMFTDFIMQRDPGAYQRFLTAAMEEPSEWRENFLEIYRIDFATALSAFQQRLNTNAPLVLPSERLP